MTSTFKWGLSDARVRSMEHWMTADDRDSTYKAST